MYSVSIKEMKETYNLKLISEDMDLTNKFLNYSDINRPALQLAGFYDYFDSNRLQIIGIVEYSYLQKLGEEERAKTLREFFSHRVSCLILCRNLDPFPEMYEYAKEFDVPVLCSSDGTTDLMGELIRWLKVQLAPRLTMHGVLVDIYGEGVLILGESGIGKSETALELVKRGHRLVADDAVEVKKVSQATIIGSCPEVIRYFIELRGIGIIDIKQMFGVQSVKATQQIDMVVKLENWDRTKEYDRLGLNEEYMEILGNNVVCHVIPIRPGRNIAIICESAAINHRQKKMGYNSAQILNERIIKNMSK